jgi:hypothetical protein
LRAQGREATAKIVRLWRTQGKGATDMVTCVFSAGSARVQGDCEVPCRFWAGLHKGADRPFRYLSSDPAVNHPAAWDENTEPMFMAIGPAGASRGGQPLSADRGRAARTSCGLRTVRASIVDMYYRLKTGRAVKPAPNEEWDGDHAAVCVLYTPQNPARDSLYPLTW